MDNKFTIRIESILGGHSPSTHFASKDQIRSSLGIDPSWPISDSQTDKYGKVASGLIRPTAANKASGSTINGAPLWLLRHPKGYGATPNETIYVYDSVGSVYSFAIPTSTFSGLGDLNDGGTAAGNGAAYNDNYVYFARATTIARYGPLNGTPTFTDDYWVSSLSKTALVDTSYPPELFNSFPYPNHPLHRHSDGKLYIGDVVGNKGTIHYISTTKSTVEGDTDNGSTYSKLQFGYGLWPTAIESYGSNLAIALYEGGVASLQHPLNRAKIAFWDTTSANANQITWVEFPDEIITGLRNIDGVLYVASGSVQSRGFRISRFVGGYTFEEVFYSEDGEPPMTGAMDGSSKRLVMGSFCVIPETSGCVFSLGLQKAALGNGIFNVMGCSNTSASVTAVSFVSNLAFGLTLPYTGWSNGGSGGTNNGFDIPGTDYSQNPQTLWGQVNRIGQKFKITKIRFPLAQAVAANMTVTPKIYVDDGTASYTGGQSNGLSIINNTNYPGAKNVVMRPENLTGEHNFWLELKWTGSALCVVGLPITIEGELIDD